MPLLPPLLLPASRAHWHRAHAHAHAHAHKRIAQYPCTGALTVVYLVACAPGNPGFYIDYLNELHALSEGKMVCWDNISLYCGEECGGAGGILYSAPPNCSNTARHCPTAPAKPFPQGTWFPHPFFLLLFCVTLHLRCLCCVCVCHHTHTRTRTHTHTRARTHTQSRMFALSFREFSIDTPIPVLFVWVRVCWHQRVQACLSVCQVGHTAANAAMEGCVC